MTDAPDQAKKAPLSQDVRIAQAVIEQLRNAGITEEDPDFKELFDAECDLPHRLTRMARAAKYRRAMAEAMKSIIEGNRKRMERHNRAADNIEEAIFWALQEAGYDKPIEAPDLTISIAKGRRSVIGSGDASALPDHLRRVKYEPEKLAIKAALEAGEVVPGYSLGNTPPSLKISTN